ncbi:hypothetical protein [Mucilaginibacter sp. SP1R1]|uniref:hypothetical protein n=1 Tax=Mucilaginibacter sp. SP1R1 TaxID=2723091 RepID=UPI001612FA9C|nr:hypothetical protein [Mucilaginibacter sp. SP1R1]MBB6148796.1 hypothetical protein [Mucilaginibacter sp. SP1R1]
MTRTVSYSIKKDTGSIINIIIEPVLTQSDHGTLSFTGVYTLYKDTDKKDKDLLDIQEIAPEIGESKPLLDDKNNPDFAGQLTLNTAGSEWIYTSGDKGVVLSVNEQKQIIAFIETDHQ